MEIAVPVDGGHLWADDSGNGPALALLHPGWGESSIWLPMLESLTPRYRVIRYDVRGYGRSPAPGAPFTQLADLIAVLDHCGVTDVMLVGHSGGGGTAIGMALASPRRVRATLLLAPGAPDYPWPLEDPYFAEFGRLFAAGDRDGLTALGLRTWAAAGPDQGAEAQVRAAVEAYFRLGDHDYLQPDPPAYGKLSQIRLPTAMVIGDRDYPPMACWAKDIAARIPQCQQIIAAGADHMLPLRMPEQLAELIGQLDSSLDLPTRISVRH